MQATIFRLGFDLLRHAVRAEDRYAVGRNFGEPFDENRTARFQRVDHPFVVHDLVPHVDRRPVFIERALDDLDGAHDTGAEAAWLGENDFHRAPPFRLALASNELSARRRGELSARIAIGCGCKVVASARDPKTSNTFAPMPAASSPAFAYMAG